MSTKINDLDVRADCYTIYKKVVVMHRETHAHGPETINSVYMTPDEAELVVVAMNQAIAACRRSEEEDRNPRR